MKKSLRPKQTAPVQRPNTTTTIATIAGGVSAQIELETDWVIWKNGRPFAGDDAE